MKKKKKKKGKQRNSKLKQGEERPKQKDQTLDELVSNYLLQNLQSRNSTKHRENQQI